MVKLPPTQRRQLATKLPPKNLGGGFGNTVGAATRRDKTSARRCASYTPVGAACSREQNIALTIIASGLQAPPTNTKPKVASMQ